MSNVLGVLKLSFCPSSFAKLIHEPCIRWVWGQAILLGGLVSQSSSWPVLCGQDEHLQQGTNCADGEAVQLPISIFSHPFRPAGKVNICSKAAAVAGGHADGLRQFAGSYSTTFLRSGVQAPVKGPELIIRVSCDLLCDPLRCACHLLHSMGCIVGLRWDFGCFLSKRFADLGFPRSRSRVGASPPQAASPPPLGQGPPARGRKGPPNPQRPTCRLTLRPAPQSAPTACWSAWTNTSSPSGALTPTMCWRGTGTPRPAASGPPAGQGGCSSSKCQIQVSWAGRRAKWLCSKGMHLPMGMPPRLAAI